MNNVEKTLTTLHLSARASGATDNQEVANAESCPNSPQLTANSPQWFRRYFANYCS